jgi:hypothetical protein
MSTKRKGVICFQKAGEDEEIFVLRAQDATAHMIVLLWARAQSWIRKRVVEDGWSEDSAIAQLEQKFIDFFPDLRPDDVKNHKIKEAIDSAKAMKGYTPKKLAD